MFCKLFLCFIGIFMGTLGVIVPDNLKTISDSEKAFYRVFENPFFMYVDFEALAAKWANVARETDIFHGDCLCYWGIDAPPVGNSTMLELLKKQLSPKEAEAFHLHPDQDNFLFEGPGLDNNCPYQQLLSMVTPKIYDYKNPIEHKGNESERERYLTFQRGYANQDLAIQAICVSADVKDIVIQGPAENYTIQSYNITVKTTGNKFTAKAHYVNFKRMASEGYLQLQFNTKMGVLQSVNEFPNSAGQFLVIPSIAPVPGFEHGETASKTVIEDSFVEMMYTSCEEKEGCNNDVTHRVFYYSEDDLKETSRVDRPPTIQSYIGVKLIANGSTVGEMIEDNHKDAEDVLYKEIHYHLHKNLQA